jgi:myosin heavy subunit
VVSQQRGERNFHIFYQLCSQAGVDMELSKRLVLLPAKDFAYIRDGEAVSVS